MSDVGTRTRLRRVFAWTLVGLACPLLAVALGLFFIADKVCEEVVEAFSRA